MKVINTTTIQGTKYKMIHNGNGIMFIKEGTKGK